MPKFGFILLDFLQTAIVVRKNLTDIIDVCEYFEVQIVAVPYFRVTILSCATPFESNFMVFDLFCNILFSDMTF